MKEYYIYPDESSTTENEKSNVFNFSYIKNEFENYKIELDCINMLGSQHYVVNEQETIVYY